jgi:hypothetical protein
MMLSPEYITSKQFGGRRAIASLLKAKPGQTGLRGMRGNGREKPARPGADWYARARGI